MKNLRILAILGISVITPCLTFLEKTSKISFSMTYENKIQADSLYSFKSKAQPHHNFSSLVTGILSSYSFNETFDSSKPDLSLEDESASNLFMINIVNFTSKGYLNFAKDYFKKKFTSIDIKNCQEYFKENPKFCEYYDKSRASFEINMFTEKNRSSYIYVNQPKQDYLLTYNNTGSVEIVSLNIPERLLYGVLVFFSLYIMWIFMEMIRLYRKKIRTKKRIEKLKKEQ